MKRVPNTLYTVEDFVCKDKQWQYIRNEDGTLFSGRYHTKIKPEVWLYIAFSRLPFQTKKILHLATENLFMYIEQTTFLVIYINQHQFSISNLSKRCVSQLYK